MKLTKEKTKKLKPNRYLMTYVWHGLSLWAIRYCSCSFVESEGERESDHRVTYILVGLLGRALRVQRVVMVVRLSWIAPIPLQKVQTRALRTWALSSWRKHGLGLLAKDELLLVVHGAMGKGARVELTVAGLGIVDELVLGVIGVRVFIVWLDCCKLVRTAWVVLFIHKS